ncbi:septum site-determining protein MinC [Butyrivibrio sp. MC2021]|uniref:septum site-determining protein MinC n=1 Tax=Butyrivibrio sp. MC2021 TaxID=1408306 RepID=UPI0006868F2C|nr:septum site-determining protein MinC [Butyrivibrio sp. MC2021]
MNQKVTIKGTKSGIILVLDPEYSFEQLEDDIAKKFKEAASFFGKSSMGLIIRGRKLSDDEQDAVVDIIENNSDLTISCIINEEDEIDKYIVEAMAKRTAGKSDEQAGEDDSDLVQIDPSNARIFKGNLRSGQDISCKESVVVLGDVKPGASVTSYGSIYILGELRGNAFAGAGGDRDCVVMALKLSPLQVRIADAIAISPDAEKGPKLRLRRKKLMSSEEEPEVAYIENGHIIKTAYGHQFLRSFYKI